MGLGRYEESVNYFDEALQVTPGMKDALIYKGMALYLAGNYDAAMEIEHFRTEFVGRFKEELLKKKRPASSSDAEGKREKSCTAHGSCASRPRNVLPSRQDLFRPINDLLREKGARLPNPADYERHYDTILPFQEDW